MRRPLLILAATVLLLGAGCDLTQRISLQNPFTSAPAVPAATARVEATPGLHLTIHPSALGFGVINDLIGRDAGTKDVVVKEFSPDRVVLDWSERPESATSTPRSGTIEAVDWANATAAVPPGFWPTGNVTSDDIGLLWLSPAAYAEFSATNSTEWGITSMGGDGLAKIQQAWQNFRRLAARLMPSASTLSPFRLEKLNDVPAFPIRLDGQMVSVEAVRAGNVLAEYVILKNPSAPLILKMTAKPAAYGALAALKPLGLDPDAFGYEVTEIRTK